jgi:predicted regulator of Ras-like GTPase activity (Roadblock/LC7/MglB family)
MELSSEARNLNWLVQNFAERVPGVNEAVVVSSDGLPIATSSGLDRDAADRFAAVSSGLIGLAYGAAGRFGGGAVNEVIIEMENAFLFVTGISDGLPRLRVLGGVRRRTRRLRDGRPRREGRCCLTPGSGRAAELPL